MLSTKKLTCFKEREIVLQGVQFLLYDQVHGITALLFENALQRIV